MKTKHMKTMFNIGYSHFIGGSTDKQKKESYNKYHKHKGWKINDDLEMFIYFDKEILLNLYPGFGICRFSRNLDGRYAGSISSTNLHPFNWMYLSTTVWVGLFFSGLSKVGSVCNPQIK